MGCIKKIQPACYRVGVAPRKDYIVDFLLITAVLIWGFNYALMKVMYRYFHPITFNAVRFVISSITMMLLLKFRGENLHIDHKDIRRILWLGFLANIRSEGRLEMRPS